MIKLVKFNAFIFFLTFIVGTVHAQTLTVASETGTLGDILTLPVSFTNENQDIVLIQFDVAFEPDLVDITNVTVGSSLEGTKFNLYSSIPSPGIRRVVIIPPIEAPVPYIPSGEIAILEIAVSGWQGSASLILQNVIPGNTNVQKVDIALINGTIIISTQNNVSCLYSLTRGWNLISFPFYFPDPAITKVLEALSNPYTIWTYKDGKWFSYDTQNPLVSDLSVLEPGYGYWLKVSSPVKLSLEGVGISKPIHLDAGWNLVGYNSGHSSSMDTLLESMKNDVEIIWTYQSGNWFSYSPDQSKLSNLMSMEPGVGYWIRTKNACTWTLP